MQQEGGNSNKERPSQNFTITFDEFDYGPLASKTLNSDI
jgi:hypothetical protein